MTRIKIWLVALAILTFPLAVSGAATSDLKSSVWVILDDMLGRYREFLFHDVISLGNRKQMREALFDPYFDVWIDRTLGADKRADYGSGRNPRYRIMRLRGLQPGMEIDVWHEFAHHLVYLTGGIRSSMACGLDETYAELLEDRIRWLDRLSRFDRAYRGMSGTDEASCKKLIREWDDLEERFHFFVSFNNDLARSYQWQDPMGTTCKIPDKVYRLDADLIRQLDDRLNIRVDIEEIKEIYASRVERCRKQACLKISDAGGTVRACRSGPRRFIYESWSRAQRYRWVRNCSQVCGWAKPDWMQ